MDMMKLTTCLAIITALTHHYLSLAAAEHTRGLSRASPQGFSLRLVSNPETSSDHTFRRRSDGFLHLHHRIGAPVWNVTAILSVATPQLYANVGTGDGQRQVLLKYDATGSLTWLQCDPCRPKARQLGPLFAPHLSPTYHNVEATSPICTTLFEPDPATGQCTFRMVKTGISVKGVIARDHFTTISGDVVPDYLFGCVHDTRVFRNGGTYAGVFVNSRAPYSFASARGVTRFSYCLSGEANHHGFLRFGTDIPRNPGYRTTRILPALGPHDAAYYVSLVGVSLGAQRLDGICPEMLRHRKDGQGGCIVDIGTPLTVMVQEAYSIIEEALWADLECYHGVERVHRIDYGLCVRVTAEAIKGHLPSMSLHFAAAGEEATLVVLPEHLFLMMEDEQAGRIACLAMAPGPRTVIGALQQVDTRFIFDLKDEKIYFAPESCTQDTASHLGIN